MVIRLYEHKVTRTLKALVRHKYSYVYKILNTFLMDLPVWGMLGYYQMNASHLSHHLKKKKKHLKNTFSLLWPGLVHR